MTRRIHSRGLSLIELLVAMAIGVVLILGATQVYVSSRNTYAVNETVARLQENARYALAVMEPDLRMANYWGLTKYPYALTGASVQTQPGSAIASNACGNNFAVDINIYLQADNGAAGGYSLACAPFNNAALATADTVTVRRVSRFVRTPPNPVGTVVVCTNYDSSGGLFSDGTPCTTQGGDLVVHTYYVDTTSSQVGVPSLRRMELNGNAFQDQEVIPGVEDMQIQFGIDPSGLNGSAQYYVDPMIYANWAALINSPPPAVAAQVVSVRIWMLLRSDQPEVGYVDNQTYSYGDRLVANGVTGDLASAGAATSAYRPSLNPAVRTYRRILVSRTVQLRNSLLNGI
jgi:type IV pilus assembly protein PilW